MHPESEERDENNRERDGGTGADGENAVSQKSIIRVALLCYQLVSLALPLLSLTTLS